MEAEFVAVNNGEVLLRAADGSELSVPLTRLADADRAFVKNHMANVRTNERQNADEIISRIAETFYSELRSEQHDGARGTLTTKAQAVMQGGQSPLAGLPAPESGRRAIRVGRVQLEGTVAEVPVLVRAGGRMHKTKLHLRQEEQAWRVFAISATYPDGEKSINFEAEMTVEQPADPLQAMLGQRLELAGRTIDGKPLSMRHYENKVVLVDFWATWCGPCRAEMPNVLANYQEYRDQGFDVIAISVDQDLAALASFVTEEKPPWAVVVDNFPGNRTSMAGQYGIRAIPAFILVGKDGRVAAVNCRGERLGYELAQLLGDRGPRVTSDGLKLIP